MLAALARGWLFSWMRIKNIFLRLWHGILARVGWSGGAVAVAIPAVWLVHAFNQISVSRDQYFLTSLGLFRKQELKHFSTKQRAQPFFPFDIKKNYMNRPSDVYFPPRITQPA